MSGMCKPGTLLQMLILVAISTAAVFISRAVYQQPLPWNYAWSEHVAATAQKQGMSAVTVDETRGIAESFSHIILDARKEADYLAGHIPGAISLPVSDVDRHFSGIAAMLTPEQPVLVYCSGLDCDESLKLGEILIAAGFTNIAIFAGGMTEWQKADLPVER